MLAKFPGGFDNFTKGLRMADWARYVQQTYVVEYAGHMAQSAEPESHAARIEFGAAMARAHRDEWLRFQEIWQQTQRMMWEEEERAAVLAALDDAAEDAANAIYGEPEQA